VDEVYTCICGHQNFIINGEERITCPKCDRIYDLKWIDDAMESAMDFNSRIRSEEREKLECAVCHRKIEISSLRTRIKVTVGKETYTPETWDICNDCRERKYPKE